MAQKPGRSHLDQSVKLTEHRDGLTTLMQKLHSKEAGNRTARGILHCDDVMTTAVDTEADDVTMNLIETTATMLKSDDATTAEAATRGVIQRRSKKFQVQKCATSTAFSWLEKKKITIFSFLIKYLPSTSQNLCEIANNRKY